MSAATPARRTDRSRRPVDPDCPRFEDAIIDEVHARASAPGDLRGPTSRLDDLPALGAAP